MIVLIIFYTSKPKPMEIHYLMSDEDIETYNKRVIELAKNKTKFALYKVGNCIGDFS
jgi:hypothetical protein